MYLTDKLRILFREENRIRLTVLLGISGAALIMLSGLLPGKQQRIPDAEPPPAAELTADLYRSSLEERLSALLSEMEGVGNVTVMITVGGSAEQVYASECRSVRSENNYQTSSAPVLTRSNGNESALLTETRYPEIRGAVILCSGGAHAAVQERVTKAAAALLGISASQIYVGQSSARSHS